MLGLEKKEIEFPMCWCQKSHLLAAPNITLNIHGLPVILPDVVWAGTGCQAHRTVLVGSSKIHGGSTPFTETLHIWLQNMSSAIIKQPIGLGC